MKLNVLSSKTRLLLLITTNLKLTFLAYKIRQYIAGMSLQTLTFTFTFKFYDSDYH